MFLVTDLTNTLPITAMVNDIKDIGDIIIGITGDTDTGNSVQVIAGHMGFGDEFISQSHFTIHCITEAELKDTDTEQQGSLLHKNTQKDVRLFLDALLDMLPKEPGGCDARGNHSYWSNNDEILCPSEAACETLAYFLQDVLKESGITVLTGWYDPSEDAKNSKCDDCSGFNYIRFE